MARVTREDAMMKIPALEHLSRLGYAYLPRKSANRDRETNIIAQTLRAAMERINETVIPPEQIAAMMEEMKARLNADDLGRAYYEMLRQGWEGLRIIDYDRPENNLWQEMTEAECRNGKSFFRPDITLYVNGLPLAMIEVKTRKQNHGVRAEYDRMLERFQNPELRRFVQGTQIWAISNGRENDPDRLLPTEGSCFATTARGDFPLHPFAEKHPTAIGRKILRADPEMIRRIREDNGLEEKTGERSADWQRGARKHSGDADSEKQETGDAAEERPSGANMKELLTGLFQPERFLFLLRYGIRYETEKDEQGDELLRKRVLSAEQFFTLLDLRGKIRRGYRNCTILPGGMAGEGAMMASLIEMAREEYPGARVYQVFQNRKELLRADEALRKCGVRCGRRNRTEDADVILMEPALNVDDWLREFQERDFAGRRIVLLPEEEYEGENVCGFRKGLRREDPEAILIHGCRGAISRGGNYVYLLECADGTLYCGWTNDLSRRLAAHNEGRGAKYTRGRGPVRLVYTEEFETREEAMRREWHVKRMPRAQKMAMIEKRRKTIEA